MVDSRRKANLPFDFRTRATPSGVVLTNTEGSADFMYDHIFSYTAILDLCAGKKRERKKSFRDTERSPAFNGFCGILVLNDRFVNTGIVKYL